jgi:hypothetical protein
MIQNSIKILLLRGLWKKCKKRRWGKEDCCGTAEPPKALWIDLGLDPVMITVIVTPYNMKMEAVSFSETPESFTTLHIVIFPTQSNL